MAMESIGAKIVLEGEKEYRKALKDIGSDQKELRSEMQLTSAQYAENQNSLEALEKKYDILGRQIEEQTKKINVYEEAVAKAKEMQSKAADSVDEYTKELDLARAELEKMNASENASAESIKAQEERVNELEKALSNSEDAYNRSSAIVNNWQTGLNNSQAVLIGLQNDLEKTSKYLDEASNSTDHCATSIDQYGKQVKDAEDKTLTFGEIMKANLASDVVMAGLETMVGLLNQAGEGLLSLATSAAFYADNVNTMSAQTGVATDTIQALQYSEELLDVSVNTVTSSMAKNIRSMQRAKDGSEKYASAYAELGVQITDTNGNLRDSETVFWEMIDALNGMNNATDRDAISMQLFGRSAQQLNPLIQAGSKGFQSLKKEAQDVGYILDGRTLKSLNNTSDSLERLSKYGDSIKNEIGAAVTDQFADALEKILEIIQENEDELKQVAETVIPALTEGLVSLIDNLDKIIPIVSGIATGFVAMKVEGLAMSAVNTVMSLFSKTAETAAASQTQLNVAMAANPVGLVVAGFGVAVGALTSYLTTQNAALDAANSYTSAISDETKALLDEADAREKRQASWSTENTTTKDLTNRLKELRSATSLTRAEQKEMSSIVDQLNAQYPELNLRIEEGTNNLNLTNEQIERNCELMQKQINIQAAQEDIAEISKELYENQARLNPLLKEQEEATQRYVEAKKELQAYQQNGDDLKTALELKQAYDDACDSLVRINEEVGAEQVLRDKLNEQYRIATDYINENRDAVKENYNEIVNWRGHAVELTTEVSAKINELRQKYDEVKEASKTSLEQQIGLFDELSNKSDLSVKQMKENLDSQTEVMNTYKDDMLKAVDLVEKGLMDEGLLGQIQEMGISGAGYLHELVEASEKDIDSFQAVMDSFADQTKAKDELAGTLAEIQTNFEETQQAIAENIVETQNNISENTEHWKENHKELWENTYDEANSAILKKHDTVVKSAFTIVDDILKTSQDVLGIDANGKSAEGDAIGTSYVESMANAILNGEGMVVNAVNTVASKALEEARARVQEIDRLLGEGM